MDVVLFFNGSLFPSSALSVLASLPSPTIPSLLLFLGLLYNSPCIHCVHTTSQTKPNGKHFTVGWSVSILRRFGWHRVWNSAFQEFWEVNGEVGVLGVGCVPNHPSM
ncbi:hypothetical protein H1C71_039571, partial [Ictidomys tridecemlineatus]